MIEKKNSLLEEIVLSRIRELKNGYYWISLKRKEWEKEKEKLSKRKTHKISNRPV